MSLLGDLFGKKTPPLTVEDPIFGRLTFGKHDGWESRTFAFWGQPSIQLIVDGDDSGPTQQQREAFAKLKEAKDTLLPRLVSALEERQAEFQSPKGGLSVSALSVPRLDDSKTGRLWTMWFVSEHDDHFQFGVQSKDDWQTFIAFADD